MTALGMHWAECFASTVMHSQKHLRVWAGDQAASSEAPMCSNPSSQLQVGRNNVEMHACLCR